MPTGIYKRMQGTKSGFQKGHTITKGHIMSAETRKKFSLAKKGKPSPMLGRHHSSETRLKMFASSRKGNQNHLWRGGVSEINRTKRENIMVTVEYKLWRKACFERDNFTCQKTGISGGRLIVHHINNYADFPELRLSIDNGITLLDKAHREFHRLYGRHNNTREQLIEWLNLGN